MIQEGGNSCLLTVFLKMGTALEIKWEGWMMSGMINEEGKILNLHNQDFIHNGKKLIALFGYFNLEVICVALSTWVSCTINL